MDKVMVFCRRWIDWSQLSESQLAGNQNSDFNRDFHTLRMLEQWKRDNPLLPLGSYRKRLQQLAETSWQSTGAHVVLHHCSAETQHHPKPEKELIRQLRTAQWVIPIDDDDWLAPDLVKHLQHPRLQRLWMASWPSQLIYIHTNQYRTTEPIAVLPETANSTTPILVSCSAGISHRFIASLSDQELWWLLLQHGETSRMHQILPQGLKLELNQCLAVHLRHQATAGSGRQANLNRRIGNFLGEQTIIPAIPWASTWLKSLDELHQAHIQPLLTD
jgi:hypothetical protein